MNNIKAIVFDLDCTLIDRKRAFLRFCDYLIDKYATDYPYEISTEELVAYMVKIDGGGYGGLQNFIPRLKEYWKLPLTTEEFIKERNGIFGTLAAAIPNLHEVLTSLKSKYKLGIITNGYSNVQREKIATVEIAHYFEDIIVSGDEPFEKPDPRIFLMSCKNLGVKPEEMVYVGDYYYNDIAGAISANITPIWITENPEEQKDYKGIVIKDISELLQLF